MASSLSLPLPPAFIHNQNFTRSRSACQSNISCIGSSQGSEFWSGRSRLKCALSSVVPAVEYDDISCNEESLLSVNYDDRDQLEFNRVNCLVWILHESARGFSLAVQAHDLARTGPELAMAWRGVDVHAWHRNISYQVAVYALLKAAIEVETFLSHKRSSNPSSVLEILSPKAQLLSLQIERELHAKNPRLVQWFKSVELPRIAGMFIPLFKKWSMEYAGSGVAGIILAISCCAAIQKLDSRRISRPSFFVSIQDTLVKLMTLSEGLVSVNKLHQLAREAGFEDYFLLHFGGKVLPCKNMEDMEFWIGLVQQKLSTAFQRESIVTDEHKFHDKVQEDNLAILGLFAYLGKETRLFLSRVGIKDLEEHCKNFLSYLECGSLLIHPNISTMSEYHLFMEVVTDEIGWLQFYPSLSLDWCRERRKCKKSIIQAEKEILLYKVLTACYDVISGFAHYSNSMKQPMNSSLLEFLLNCQSLLSTCMDDYWAAFDGISSEPQKLLERGFYSLPSTSFEEHMSRKSSNLENEEVVTAELDSASSIKTRDENFVQKSIKNAISTSLNGWMGTQLLYIDILEVMVLVKKQIHGGKVTKREKKKIKRTLSDFATLVPVVILMLLPVSAVGHAAMLAGIKKYMPCLIPSPYTSERLGLVKQLKRVKKMEFPKRSNIEDSHPEFSDTVNV